MSRRWGVSSSEGKGRKKGEGEREQGVKIQAGAVDIQTLLGQ